MHKLLRINITANLEFTNCTVEEMDTIVISQGRVSYIVCFRGKQTGCSNVFCTGSDCFALFFYFLNKSHNPERRTT